MICVKIYILVFTFIGIIYAILNETVLKGQSHEKVCEIMT
jgi:hypothetical protein